MNLLDTTPPNGAAPQPSRDTRYVLRLQKPDGSVHEIQVIPPQGESVQRFLDSLGGLVVRDSTPPDDPFADPDEPGLPFRIKDGELVYTGGGQ